MAKIIVDINEDNKYHFVVKKDTNHPVAYSDKFCSKDECLRTLDQFKLFADQGIHWHYDSDSDGFHFASFKTLEGHLISTKKFASRSKLISVVTYIKDHITFKTPVFHTVVRNSKFHNNA